MARITVEDCLIQESNRFALVRLASRRAKQLLTGSSPVTDTRGNRAIVSALREIADGKVRFRKREEGDEGSAAHANGETSGVGVHSAGVSPAGVSPAGVSRNVAI